MPAPCAAVRMGRSRHAPRAILHPSRPASHRPSLPENRSMKRVILLSLVLVVVSTDSGCCRRGLRCWGLRGARCAGPSVVAPAPAPCFPACPPPTFSPCPPVECPPTTACDPCCDPAISTQPFSTTPPMTTEPYVAPVPGTENSTFIPGGFSVGSANYGKIISDRVVSVGEPTPKTSRSIGN